MFSSNKHFADEAISRGFIEGAVVRTLKGAKVTIGPNPDYRLNGTRSWIADSETSTPILYRDGRWATLIAAPASDSVIRVGDTVERRNDGGLGVRAGDRGQVLKLDNCVALVHDQHGRKLWHSLTNLKKVTTGAVPSTATKTTISHEQVFGSTEGQGHGRGEGRAIRAGSGKSIVATASRLTGNPVAPRIREGRIGGGKIGFTAICG